MTRLAWVCSAPLFLFVALARAAVPVATYEFENNFLANEPGAPALAVVDPLGASGFQNDTVLGINRPVWAFNGNAQPTNQQAGLTVSTAGLIAPHDYSIDMVFLFTQRDNAWRRIIDVENRQSDDGFYVDPSNNLDIFPTSGSTNAWNNNVYHHVVLTNDGMLVSTYIDGVSQFSFSTNLMNIDNANNPGATLSFFIDNVVAGGQGEFSDGKVGLIRLWNGVLSPSDAQQIAANPFVTNFLRGDFNRDGLVNSADIQAMLNCLTDIPAYKTLHALTDVTLDSIGDFNNDGILTNADIQGLLKTLAQSSGGGGISPVPEPTFQRHILTGIVMLLLFDLACCTRRRNARGLMPKPSQLIVSK
jgi:Concanavalin A-like lectin/glucanases superfamily